MEMIDREKVVKGLECCSSLDSNCAVCPYNYDGEGGESPCLRLKLIPDALALLKEQKAKQVIDIVDSIEGIEVGYCPSCDRSIVNKKDDETKFCKFCGQTVTWNA